MSKKETDNNQADNDIQPVDNINSMADMIKTALLAILIALVIRTFAFEPFSIPSGSMIPTLKVGDYLFVSKYAYGYSRYSFPTNLINFRGRVFYNEPERGDVAVFKKPYNTNIDYIKRIIGLPGDKIQMRDGVLHINNEAVPRVLAGGYKVDDYYTLREMTYHRYNEYLPDGKTHQIIERSDMEALDNTQSYVVPAGHFFVMGDNRDGSQDSRVMDKVGFVPVENLVGRAEVLFFSVDEGASGWEFWKWPWTVRFSRIFQTID